MRYGGELRPDDLRPRPLSKRLALVGVVLLLLAVWPAVYLARDSKPARVDPGTTSRVYGLSRAVASTAEARGVGVSLLGPAWLPELSSRRYAYMIVSLDAAKRAARSPSRSLVYFS